jgi:hypothetical protein
MNRRKILVIVAFAALVAGSAALVYAQEDEQGTAQVPKTIEGQPASGGPPAAPAAQKNAAESDGQGPQVLYDFKPLPEPVQRMLADIIYTAETGNMEAMRPVLESREFKPMVAAEFISDPVAYWKEHSVDGSGRDVLAAMLNMLASGFVLTGEGSDAIYVWPYFAEVDLTKLTPAQQVEFYRFMPSERAAAMMKSGKYDYYRLGISPKGVWQYFIQ